MDRELSSTSWGAILAGGFITAAVTLILAAFAVGAGLAAISPWGGEGISATTASWAAGLLLVAVAMIASTVGGYVTGRLRHAWEDVNENERFFRDTAHGLATWALATVMTATVLAGAGTHLLAAASTGTIPAAGAGVAQAGSGMGDVYLDRLLRSGAQTPSQPQAQPLNADQPQTQAQPQRPQGDAAATRAELGRLVFPVTAKGGDISEENRAYAARLIAQRTGLSETEARQRVDQTITQAKSAADAARKGAMKLSLWIAASLLAGALAASLAAAEGGKLRNTRWYETVAVPPAATTTLRS